MEDSKKEFKEIVSDKLADIKDFCDENGMTIIVVGSLSMMAAMCVIMTKDYNRYLRDLETMVSYSLK